MKMKPVVKKRFILSIVILLVAILALPMTSMGQKGRPEGKGPSAGQGGGGGDQGGIREGTLYGDPMLLIRDLSPTGDGKPVGFQWIWPQDLYTPDGELGITYGDIPDDYDDWINGGCPQPFSRVPLPEVGELFTYNWLDSYGNPVTVYLIPLDAECKIPDVYETAWGTLAEEIDAGRLNFARTTQWVIDSAYGKVLEAINAAQNISLDPAGRLLLDDKTIDSPRENLALYQKLMQMGCLAPIPAMDIGLNDDGKAALNRAGMAYLVCSANGTATYTDDMLLRAASFLAGAADKFGRIHTDLVIFINSILRVNNIEVTDEGIIYIKDYFDFGQFKYDRRLQHNDTTASLLQGGPSLFHVQENLSFYGKVFRGDWMYPGGPYGNASYPGLNFVRAADDALAIIFYIHNYAVPDMIEEGVID